MIIALMEVYQSMKEKKENLTKDNGFGDEDKEQIEKKIYDIESSDFSDCGRYHWGFCQAHNSFLIRLPYPQGWVEQPYFHHV